MSFTGSTGSGGATGLGAGVGGTESTGFISVSGAGTMVCGTGFSGCGSSCGGGVDRVVAVVTGGLD